MPSAGAAHGCTCLLAALLVLLVALLADASAALAGPRPLRTGVSYVYEPDPTTFENVRRTGAKLVLTPLRWADVAPAAQPADWQPENPADPNYDWGAIDEWVSNAVQAGLTPVLQVRGAPIWAQRCPGASETDSPCDINPVDLAAFATAAASRYSGRFGSLPRVRYWQGLDEPNLSLFFTPQFEGGKAVSATLYRTLINSFYSAVKSVSGTDVVIAGGLGPIAVPKYTIGPMRFTRELLCMRGKDRFRPAPGNCHGGVHFDAYDIHPYTTGGPTHEGGANDVELGDLPKLQRLLAAADRAGRIKGGPRHTPLWVTEFSWDSKPPDPGGLPMKIETRWTAEALYRAWRAGVSDFFWFSLRDFPYEPSRPFSETLQSGLYFRGPTPAEDRPKEVLYAFRFPFVAYPREKGLFFWGRTPSSGPGKVAIQVLKGGHWRRAFAVRAAKNGVFQGVVPSGYGRDRSGAVRARFANQNAIPFSMHPVPDFRQPPFG
jgi:hypothetical protein